MCFIIKSIVFIIIYFYYYCTCNTVEIKFDNKIEAVGFPYYKILMALGDCKETVLFHDQKAWSKVRLNRIVDIYYKSHDPEMIVSRVEIEVVLNDTDCFVITRTGVGHYEFTGTLFIPTRAAIVLYQLYIFTCSRPRTKHRPNPIYNKLKSPSSNLHKTAEVFYQPKLFYSSNEENDDKENETNGSLINYAPIGKEADHPVSVAVDQQYD